MTFLFQTMWFGFLPCSLILLEHLPEFGNHWTAQHRKKKPLPTGTCLILVVIYPVQVWKCETAWLVCNQKDNTVFFKHINNKEDWSENFSTTRLSTVCRQTKHIKESLCNLRRTTSILVKIPWHGSCGLPHSVLCKTLEKSWGQSVTGWDATKGL